MSKATKIFFFENFSSSMSSTHSNSTSNKVPITSLITIVGDINKNLSPTTWHLGDKNSKELLAHDHTRSQEYSRTKKPSQSKRPRSLPVSAAAASTPETNFSSPIQPNHSPSPSIIASEYPLLTT